MESLHMPVNLNSYLEPNFLSGKNEFFCNFCSIMVSLNDAAFIFWNETALSNDISHVFFCKNVSWEYQKKGRGNLWVSECWSLQDFCIPAVCIAAGIYLACFLASIFKERSHHWWPFWTYLEVALLVSLVIGTETGVV